MEIWQSIVTGIITGAFSAGAIWGVLSTKINYLSRDVDLAHARITEHERDYHRPRGN